MLTPIAVTAAAAIVAFTGRRVALAAMELSRETRRTRVLREFVDAFAVELMVGARPVDAADQALVVVSDTPDGRHTVGVGLVGGLQRAARRVRLGGVVAAGPVDPAVTDNSVDVDDVLRLWAVAERHGMAMGQVMRRLVADTDARLAHLGHTSSALAGARLTEIILLLLPVGAVGIGESMGLAPAAFLIGNILGILVLLAGIVLACAGVLWVESLTVTVLGGVGGRAGPAELGAARVLDVFGAATASGLPVSVAWRAAVSGAGDGTGKDAEALRRVALLLELGAGVEAWRPLHGDPCFGPVARRAATQVRNGARMSDEISGQADRLRRQAGDRSRAGAERVLVAVAAPLTLCFLPAFVLVGLLPLVVGFAGV
ncbi:MAG: type II secretion system F family protein [Mycobacteriaceae bacterium]|uniref:type II secretion system F family protein n=1 Tax=Corynebacterium sp. TaxID=1720 RepID=UPI003F9930B1